VKRQQEEAKKNSVRIFSPNNKQQLHKQQMKNKSLKPTCIHSDSIVGLKMILPSE
jgi:hypothetical protein